MIGGFKEYGKQEATKRQEALQLQKYTQDLRDQGYDVNEDMVKKSLEPESGISKILGGTKLGSMFGVEKQTRPDLYGKRTAAYEDKQKQAAEDRDLDRQYKKAQIGKFRRELSPDGHEAKKRELELKKLQNELAATGNGKQMSATEIAKFDEGNQIPSMLKDIKNTIDLNKGNFGPISGRIASINPWDEKGQTINSQMKTASQAFGKFMEGGVLRKEDEAKYEKMFPSQSDTPDIAANKLAIVERLLAEKQNSTVGALKGAGYNTASIDKGLNVPDVPSVLAGGKTGSWANDAAAKDPVVIKQQLKQMSREDKIRLLQGGSPR